MDPSNRSIEDRTCPPLEVLVLDLIKEVLAGRKGNNAVHNILKRTRLPPEERSTLIRTFHNTLRYWYLIKAEIGTDDPVQMAAFGVLLFTDHFPASLRIEKARMAVLQKRAGNPTFFKNHKGWNNPDSIPADTALNSVPAWLKKRLMDAWGDEAGMILADSLVPPKFLGIRTNTLLASRDDLVRELELDGIKAEISELDGNAILVPDGSSIDRLSAYREGRMEVQDISSQIACRLAISGYEKGRVIDACAGNGGKTLALSALMNNKGLLISMDPNERSLSRLRQRGRRAGIWNYQRVHLDNDAKLGPYMEWADVVLIDAPCSGLGTLRRNPDIKVHLAEERMRELPLIQSELLRKYSLMVRPGGRLVYSTCSIDPAENERVVEGFLEEKEGYHVIPARDNTPELPKELFRGPYFYPMPGYDRSGFFLAILEMA